jgi:fructokinase
MLVTPSEVIHQPGIETIIKDTVGAGDSFTASFLMGLLQKIPHAENLRRACTVAAEVCSRPGAVPS